MSIYNDDTELTFADYDPGFRIELPIISNDALDLLDCIGTPAMEHGSVETLRRLYDTEDDIICPNNES